jgi:putative SOS response-associated peptidase YedK
MRHHGFVIIKAFFEWVAVRDLIKAGTVSIDEVEAGFQRQQVERKAKILAAGKTYKPTPTELKKTVDRQTIIQFAPEDDGDLIVPVIFSRDPIRSTAELFNGGFAIITDMPPPEIQRAGHDRCPVIFDIGAEMEWMNVRNKTAHDLEMILGQRRRTTFKHQLAEAS